MRWKGSVVRGHQAIAEREPIIGSGGKFSLSKNAYGNDMGKILCRNPGCQVTPVAPSWGRPCHYGL